MSSVAGSVGLRIDKTLERGFRAAVRKIFPRGIRRAGIRKLVVICGNGLTRNASMLAPGEAGDLSYENWVREALEASPGKPHFDFLRQRGYLTSEILSIALDGASKRERKKIWKPLWDFSYGLMPSPLHHALAAVADTIITTNYDTLFEEAVRGLQGWPADRVPSVRVNSFVLAEGDRETFKISPDRPGEYQGAREMRAPRIFKLHGSFPDRHAVAANSPDLGYWVHHNSHKTVADRDAYVALAMSSDVVFRKGFRSVLKELTADSMVLLFGLGMGSEELTLVRLFEVWRAKQQQATPHILPVVVEPAQEPLFRLRRLDRCEPILVPLGLASSAETRCYTWLRALTMAVGSLDVTSAEKRRRAGAVEHAIETLLQPRKDFFRQTLLTGKTEVAVAGQVSWNRVIGTETAVAQERAYEAARVGGKNSFSWSPGADSRKLILSHEEIGGQGAVPALLLDALGIRAALFGAVGLDTAGDQIVAGLQRTEFLDFAPVVSERGGVDELADRGLSRAVPATENATVVTWAGLRSITDSHRTPALPIDWDSPIVAEALRVLMPSVWYVTKITAPAVLKQIAAGAAGPELVYDSGGLGDWGLERELAKQGAFLLLSPLAGIRWLARSRDGNDRRSNAVWLDEEWKEARGEWRGETKDERGRLQQLARFIDLLSSHVQAAPGTPLHEELDGARMVGVTLGELGILYWAKGAEGWNRPLLCCPARQADWPGGLRPDRR